jgi:hypothetical protein
MISINPVITTNAPGTFSTSLDGMMQGMAMDDPSIRYQLTGGQLAADEVLPMFGGIPICERLQPIPPANPSTGLPMAIDSSLQNSITRATAALGAAIAAGVRPVTGISVFNQNHAMINSPQSPVPQASNGMLVNFYRWGSRARIPMAMDPALALIVANPGYGVMPSALGWNNANQWVSGAGAVGAGGFIFPTSINVIGYNYGNSMVVAYDDVTGFATWVRNGDTILLEI